MEMSGNTEILRGQQGGAAICPSVFDGGRGGRYVSYGRGALRPMAEADGGSADARIGGALLLPDEGRDPGRGRDRACGSRVLQPARRRFGATLEEAPALLPVRSDQRARGRPELGDAFGRPGSHGAACLCGPLGRRGSGAGDRSSGVPARCHRPAAGEYAGGVARSHPVVIGPWGLRLAMHCEAVGGR